MAISMGGGGEERPMSDINTTPLVDVMLVLLIIFLIAVPVAMQTIEKLEIPIFESVESKDKVENLLLTVTTTDAQGQTAGTRPSGFTGATREGECRVYINNTTLVDLAGTVRPGVRAARRDRAARGRPGSADGQPGPDPAGAYSCGRQHPVALRRRRDLQHPGGRLPDRRLHFQPR